VGQRQRGGQTKQRGKRQSRSGREKGNHHEKQEKSPASINGGSFKKPRKYQEAAIEGDKGRKN